MATMQTLDVDVRLEAKSDPYLEHIVCADASTTEAAKDWSYVSEGGASIVFSYVGPSHPIFDGTVLRLRKSSRSDSVSIQHILPTPQEVADDEPDDSSIIFQEVVTSKLIPKAHLPRLQTVKVTSQWLQQLAVAVESRRPIERTMVDVIDVSKRKGVLATDLVGGKGWAVEIKPKWGFLPTRTHLSPATQPLKTRHCRFCMHVHLKKQSETSVAEGYCPLDLFSGDESRVKRALERLWEAWVRSDGKVNNFRVFVDGSIIDPGDFTSYKRLAVQFAPLSATQQFEDVRQQLIDTLLPLLIGTPLLSTLSHLQRTLDSLDIEGLSKLWSKFHAGVPLGQGTLDPLIAEWAAFVNTYLSAKVPTGGEENLRYNILAYLLSATFKDCSIILRQRKEDLDGRVGNTITAIDLDPKHVSRLAKWEALDNEIVTAFREVELGRQACLDALA